MNFFQSSKTHFLNSNFLEYFFGIFSLKKLNSLDTLWTIHLKPSQKTISKQLKANKIGVIFSVIKNAKKLNFGHFGQKKGSPADLPNFPHIENRLFHTIPKPPILKEKPETNRPGFQH